MLKLVVLLAISAGIRGNDYNQSTYYATFERAVLTQNNPKFFKYFHVLNTKFNRTTRTMSIRLESIKDFPELIARVQVYVFLSNEYRIFPIRVNVDYCKAFEKNYFGFHDFIKQGNLTMCPIKTGAYYVSNYSPESSKFPPNMPIGSYKLDVAMIADSEIAFAIDYYVTIHKIYRYKKTARSLHYK